MSIHATPNIHAPVDNSEPQLTSSKATVVNVLSIAGSDPSGGAGIQADIKSISALGGYALAAITALTAQNTQGVSGVHVPENGFLTQQLEAISADVTLHAVKIGMLPNAAAIEELNAWLKGNKPPVVVLDPVMVATSGDVLMDAAARKQLLELLPQANLVTPNLPELAVLIDQPLADGWEQALAQGKVLAVNYGVNVLVKGGHLEGEQCPDALVMADGSVEEFILPRVQTASTHGTGCSLSAALATLQAQNDDWSTSVRQSKDWLQAALENAHDLNVGQGRGPVNHFHALWQERHIATADEIAQEFWDLQEPALEQILELDFIKQLSDGTLPQHHFAYYVYQDALYLNAYSKVLARASILAPNETEQQFWAGGAQNCLEVEQSLHFDWLNKHAGKSIDANDGGTKGALGTLVSAGVGPVTKAYTDHLRAIAFDGTYAEVTAAVLPCYWLYAEVGRILYGQNHHEQPNHPYRAWLESYSDEAFAQATRKAVDYASHAAARSTVNEQAKVKEAFAHAAQYEIDFFDAARLHADSAVINTTA